MWASYKGHETVVQEYLERGADPNVKAEVNLYYLIFVWCKFFTLRIHLLWEGFYHSETNRKLQKLCPFKKSGKKRWRCTHNYHNY